MDHLTGAKRVQSSAPTPSPLDPALHLQMLGPHEAPRLTEVGRKRPGVADIEATSQLKRRPLVQDFGDLQRRQHEVEPNPDSSSDPFLQILQDLDEVFADTPLMSLGDPQRLQHEAEPNPDSSSDPFLQILQDLDEVFADTPLMSLGDPWHMGGENAVAPTAAMPFKDARLQGLGLSPDQQTRLAAVLAAKPRRNEAGKDLYRSAINHARALKKHDDQLGLEALAQGSGVTVQNLNQDPRINPPSLTSDQQTRLTNALAVHPRLTAAGEDLHGSDFKHARALKAHDGLLDFNALAAGSGVRVADIQRDRTLNPVPLALPDQQSRLVAALAAKPRRDDAGHDLYRSAIKHARALKKHDDQLGFEAIAEGSGAIVKNLKQDPTFNPPRLTSDQQTRLANALAAHPRPTAEGKDLYGSDAKHARALKAHDSLLDFEALAAGSGVRVPDIKKDRKLNPLEQALPDQHTRLTAVLAIKPRKNEAGKDLYGSAILHARALNEQDAQLGFEALAEGAGTKVAHIKADPKINPPRLTSDQQSRLANALTAMPRIDETGKDLYRSALGHARALKAYDGLLSVQALAVGSGAHVCDLKRRQRAVR